MSGLDAWLAGRRPTPPMDLGPWLPRDAGGTDRLRALRDAGLTALDRALALPGRQRDAAFHLLAADALITYACEAALEAEDPVPLWNEILHAVAGGGFREP